MLIWMVLALASPTIHVPRDAQADTGLAWRVLSAGAELPPMDSLVRLQSSAGAEPVEIARVFSKLVFDPEYYGSVFDADLLDGVGVGGQVQLWYGVKGRGAGRRADSTQVWTLVSFETAPPPPDDQRPASVGPDGGCVVVERGAGVVDVSIDAVLHVRGWQWDEGTPPLPIWDVFPTEGSIDAAIRAAPVGSRLHCWQPQGGGVARTSVVLTGVDEPDPPDGFDAVPIDATTEASGRLTWTSAGAGRVPGPDDGLCLRGAVRDERGRSLIRIDTYGSEGWCPALAVLPAELAELARNLHEGDVVRAKVPGGIAWPGTAADAPRYVGVWLDVVQPRVPPPADVAAPGPEAIALAQGGSWRALSAGVGAGPRPSVAARVTISYTHWTPEGVMLQSTVVDGQPSTVTAAHLGPIVTEVLTQMSPGERSRVWLPTTGAGDGWFSAGTMDIELVRFVEPEQPPLPVAAPPADAVRGPRGLAWVVLTPASGRHPRRTDDVTTHYTGWTTDGAMFDSSRERGEAASFPLNAVIPGWSAVVRRMAVGERLMVWIPEELAYRGAMGPPAGTLVFEIELLGIGPGR